MTCFKCNRPLSNPASMRAGIGPVCQKKLLAEQADRMRNDHSVQYMPFNGDIICRRLEDGTKQVNIERRLMRHSPSGFEWGYGGSGPADFALNALLMYTDRPAALELYQKFKWDFISQLPFEGGTIKGEVVKAWLAEKTKNLDMSHNERQYELV